MNYYEFKEHTIDLSRVSDEDLKEVYQTLSKYNFEPNKINLRYLNEDLGIWLGVTYEKEDAKQIKEEAEQRFSENIFELL